MKAVPKDEIKFRHPILRNDIGEDLQEALPVLHDNGFALSMEY